MKKSYWWVILALVACVGGMGFIHWRAIRAVDVRTAQVEQLYKREVTIDSMNLGLERYRRLSSSFRKLSPGEVQGAKDQLKTTFKVGLAQLEALGLAPEEAAATKKTSDQLIELLSESAQYEAALYTKDAYAKPEIRSMHEAIVESLGRIKKSSQSQIEASTFHAAQAQLNSVWLLLSVGGAVIALVLFVMLKDYLLYFRPLRKLHSYALSLRKMTSISAAGQRLSGIYGEVQSVLEQLMQRVESHSKERHKFVQDVVSDLKSPLSMLQSGKDLLNRDSDPDRQMQVADSMKRGLAILSGSLDDLNDVAEINRLESRLEEKTIDLSELVSDVARTMGGSSRPIALTVPPMPIWTLLDGRRLERVLIQTISKVSGTLNKGSGLEIIVSDSTEGRHAGVEVTIREASSRKNDWAPSGPEMDILKHWISDKGLGMALAQKVIRVHGGSMTASGIAGSSVQVTIRIPQERVLSLGLIAPPTALTGLSLNGAATPGEAPSKFVIKNSL